MNRTVTARIVAGIIFYAGAWGSRALAADDADELAKKLSNPVAALISVPFQLNWAGLGIAPGLHIAVSEVAVAAFAPFTMLFPKAP